MSTGVGLHGSSEISILTRNFSELFIMQEEQNPYSNVESFDTIYYSTLQVIIVASTNGVRILYLSGGSH
jgi:hypothetical protein